MPAAVRDNLANFDLQAAQSASKRYNAAIVGTDIEGQRQNQDVQARKSVWGSNIPGALKRANSTRHAKKTSPPYVAPHLYEALEADLAQTEEVMRIQPRLPKPRRQTSNESVVELDGRTYSAADVMGFEDVSSEVLGLDGRKI